jgi:AcrR family transcriptional regulator
MNPVEVRNKPRAKSRRRRPHTGRARNEVARSAILATTLELLSTRSRFSVEAVAAHAGVGKQTIYRWWPSKGALVLDALIDASAKDQPAPDTGTLRGDLRALLVTTFKYASDPSVSDALRAGVTEAQVDVTAAEMLRRFVDGRRGAFRRMLDRARSRGEVPQTADIELIIDQAFGVLWYRLLMGHRPLSRSAAIALAEGLVGQITACRD